MKKRTRFLQTGLMVLGLSLPLHAVELIEALKQSVKSNPTIKERLKNYNAVVEDLNYAYGAYLPTLDVRLGWGREGTNSNFTQGKSVTLDAQDYSTSLNYNLFNGFGDMYAISQQEYRLKSAAYSYVENVDDTLLKLVEAYINVLRHKELMEVESDNIKMDEKIYTDMITKQKKGASRLSDLKEARSKLALAYTNHLSEENSIQDVLINLHKVLGRYVQLSEITVPEFYEQLPSTVEEVTRLALENNPSIKVAYYEMMATKSEYKASRKNYFPSVDFELSASYTKNLSGIESTNQNIKGFVYVNYNLFNGLRDSSYAQKKISTVHQKHEELNKIKRDVMESIQLAWAAFRVTSKQSIFINWYVKSSKDKLNSYYREFNVNSQQRSLIDLLGASDDYNNARRKMINTKYDLIFARYRLLDAMGDLSSALEITSKNVVGLGYKAKPQYMADVLPVNNDKDKDGIVDSNDICTGSENNISSNHYGCVNKVHSNNSGFSVLEQFLLENMDDKLEEENSELDGLE